MIIRKLRRALQIGRQIREQLLLAAGIPPSWLIKYDLLPRDSYALGLLLASAEAQTLGVRKLTIIELGVGGGLGMLNLARLCGLLSKEMGLSYEIVGFDSGQGLPDPKDYRDHPEIWKAEQFTHDREQLNQQLPAGARVIYGDVVETIPPFVARLGSDAPIGFVALDLDYYSSSKLALDGLLTSTPEKYLPAIVMYVDDIDSLLTYNDSCGEALAISEFNAEQPLRKIQKKPVRANRAPKFWHRQIHCAHVLDHPVRRMPGNNPLGGEHEISVLKF